MGAPRSCRGGSLTMRIGAALFAALALHVLGESDSLVIPEEVVHAQEIDPAIFEEIEAGVAQAAKTLNKMQGDEVSELDSIAGVGKQKMKKAMLKAKLDAAKTASKEKLKAHAKLIKIKKMQEAKLKKSKKVDSKKVASAARLKNTGMSRLKAVITRAKERFKRRMIRAKATVTKVQRRVLQRLQRSSGGKAASKAAQKLRQRSRAKHYKYETWKMEQKQKLRVKISHHAHKAAMHQIKAKYRHLQHTAHLQDQLRRERDKQKIASTRRLTRQQEARGRKLFREVKRAQLMGAKREMNKTSQIVKAPVTSNPAADKLKARKAALKAQFQAAMIALQH